MDATKTNSEDKYRLAFKKFNPFMIWMWRLGFGRWVNFWPAVVGRIMVITHVGRKSGLHYRTPVNYAQVDGEIYCTAGFGSVSDWYRNMLANPQIELWLPNGRWMAKAQDISNDERRVPLLRQVIIASGAVGPMMGVDPKKMDDTEFARLTTDYKLVRIHRIRPLSGPGGSGDLAWVWILPLVALAVFLGVRRLVK